MNGQWLLVLGAGRWQLPVIAAAQAAGLRVVAVDRDAGQPGFALADSYALCDLTDADGLTTLAKRYGVAGVLAATSDVAVPAAAVVASRLWLVGPGVRAAGLCTDKSALATLAADVGLATRRRFVLQHGDAVPEWFGTCVAKPVDNQSGRGVSKVDRSQDLRGAIALAMQHSRSRRVAVEEWLTGVEYIVDGAVEHGHLHLLGVARKRRDPGNPTVAVGIDYLMPPERNEMAAQVLPQLQDLVNRCQWGSSLLHAEWIDSPAGPQLIDLAARGGGALIFSHALPAHLDADVVSMAIDLSLGQSIVVPQAPTASVVIEFLRCPSGRFERFDGLEAISALPQVVAVHQAAQPGDLVGIAADKDARPALIVVRGPHLQSAQLLARQCKDNVGVYLSGYQARQNLL